MTDEELLSHLEKHDLTGLKTLVMDYSEDMLILAYTLTDDRKGANDIVSSILVTIWRVGPPKDLTDSIHSFLYQQVRKLCAQDIHSFFKPKIP